jgi:hypothetical protein
VQWEGGVNLGEFGYKVFLEGPDGAFNSVEYMTARRNQLVSDIMFVEEIL